MYNFMFLFTFIGNLRHTMNVSLLCWRSWGSLLLVMLTAMFAQQVPDVEMSALSALHSSTDGEKWQWRKEQEAGAVWNFTLDADGKYIYNPCSSSAVLNQTWQGVTCSHNPQVCSIQTCHVTMIELSFYGLSGSLPSNISGLLFLESLYLNYNQLTGSIPREMGNLTNLITLYLYNNQLTGSIPSEMGQLTALELLYLYSNQLVGAIPSEMGQLAALEQLAIYSNQLTGTIPREVGQLTALKVLYLYRNQLTGSIPSEVGQLADMVQLYLFRNKLSGSIPSEVGNLTALLYLSLYYNMLTGTIPSEVGQLTALRVLDLYENQLTGTIPSEVGQLKLLAEIAIFNNQLTGTIPYEFGQLTSLKEIFLSNNQLTGIIPCEIGKLTALEILYLYRNQLTGFIPSEVGQLTALQNLYVLDNQLTGTIPCEVGQLTALEILYFYSNQLTGTIPSLMGNLTAIQQLALYNNQLSGTIPRELGKLTSLEILALSSNQLTGTISDEVGKITALEQLTLYINYLTGTIPNTIGYLENIYELWLQDNFLVGTLPTEMSRMAKLGSVFLQDNLLTGHLENIFNPSTQLELTTIDFSNNLLTGSLSTEMFLLPRLQVLSLSVNCFAKEELPQSLCSAGQVEVLSLNGLRGAEGCTGRVVVPLSGVGLFNTVGGTVPSCVWDLKNLSVLHLTGNGLSGKLVHSLPASSQISDLSLSYNQLSGTIPLDILNIASLDLSYNRLGGEYGDRSQYLPDTDINLEINRLSGKLPVSGVELGSNGSLSILHGNLFSCNSIPENDEYSHDYVCGSRNLNASLFVFMSVFISVVLVMVWAGWTRVTSEKHYQRHPLVAILHSRGVLMWTYMTFVKNLNMHDLNRLCTPAVRKIAMLSATFVEVMQYAVQLLVVILTGSFILYLVKTLDSSETYTTHSQTFAWFWTLAYMRGVVPAGMLLLLWAGAISACFYRIIVRPARRNDGSRSVTFPGREAQESQLSTAVEEVSFRQHVGIGVAFAFNACITIAVNTMYIYSTQKSLGASIHFYIQLSLSMFRLLYSLIAFPLLSRPIRSAVENVRFRFILLIINNLLIPCVVTALTSDSCFQGLLIPADAVSTPYVYRTCFERTTILDGGGTFCSKYINVEVESASLIPPFTYNNQCGSVVLTSYIPVFLLGYSMQLLLALIALASLSYLPYDSIPHFVFKMLHGVIWPKYWLQASDALDHNRIVVGSNPDALLKICSIYCNDVFNNWMLLLTFGLCSPVLAVAVVCSVLLKMALWVLLIGRFTRNVLQSSNVSGNNSATDIATATTSSQASRTLPSSSSSSIGDQNMNQAMHFALSALAEVYIPLFEVLTRSFWRLVWCSAIFIAILGWDMATDEVGWLRSVWVPLVSFGYVLLLHCVAYVYCSDGTSYNSKQTSAEKTEISQRNDPSIVSQSPFHEDKL